MEARINYPKEPEHGESYYAQRILDLQDELVEIRDFFSMTEQRALKRRVGKALKYLGSARLTLDEFVTYTPRDLALRSKKWSKIR